MSDSLDKDLAGPEKPLTVPLRACDVYPGHVIDGNRVHHVNRFPTCVQIATTGPTYSRRLAETIQVELASCF